MTLPARCQAFFSTHKNKSSNPNLNANFLVIENLEQMYFERQVLTHAEMTSLQSVRARHTTPLNHLDNEQKQPAANANNFFIEFKNDGQPLETQPISSAILREFCDQLPAYSALRQMLEGWLQPRLQLRRSDTSSRQFMQRVRQGAIRFIRQDSMPSLEPLSATLTEMNSTPSTPRLRSQSNTD